MHCFLLAVEIFWSFFVNFLPYNVRHEKHSTQTKPSPYAGTCSICRGFPAQACGRARHVAIGGASLDYARASCKLVGQAAQALQSAKAKDCAASRRGGAEMTNAFTAGNNGFKPFKSTEQAKVSRNIAQNRSSWNRPIEPRTMSDRMDAALRSSQIDALQRQTHNR